MCRRAYATKRSKASRTLHASISMVPRLSASDDPLLLEGQGPKCNTEERQTHNHILLIVALEGDLVFEANKVELCPVRLLVLVLVDREHHEIELQNRRARLKRRI